MGANLERGRLALLDAWSDGNATPHDRVLPLEEAFAVGLAETWPFLWPFLSRSFLDPNGRLFRFLRPRNA
jgi:hypothetical protein